jgi:hypothetical protein
MRYGKFRPVNAGPGGMPGGECEAGNVGVNVGRECGGECEAGECGAVPAGQGRAPARSWLTPFCLVCV